MASKDAQHVAVIGGGIIGAATCEALIRAGCRVTLIEPESPGGPQGASYGNGAFISPASVIPMSAPGLWKKVPGYLLDRDGPFTLRWPYLPRLAGWLLRFLAAGWTEARVTRTAGDLAGLLADAPALHQALATRIGAPELLRDGGLLYLYTDRAAYAADRLSWDLRRRNGVRMTEIEEAELRTRLPGLAPRYRFAIWLSEGKHCTDPGGYVGSITQWCTDQGMARIADRATGFLIAQGRLQGVRMAGGTLLCDSVVIAAGIRSAALARLAGDAIPLEAERGYHVELPDATLDLPVPVMPQDLKVAIVRTRGGLRVAGQVELASADAAPDWHRADLLRAKVLSCFPELGATDPARARRWQGNRPSTPDGLPVIGRARALDGVFYAFGHGHIGLNAAPQTARIVTAMITGQSAEEHWAPFAASRFGPCRHRAATAGARNRPAPAERRSPR